MAAFRRYLDEKIFLELETKSGDQRPNLSEITTNTQILLKTHVSPKRFIFR